MNSPRHNATQHHSTSAHQHISTSAHQHNQQPTTPATATTATTVPPSCVPERALSRIDAKTVWRCLFIFWSDSRCFRVSACVLQLCVCSCTSMLVIVVFVLRIFVCFSIVLACLLFESCFACFLFFFFGILKILELCWHILFFPASTRKRDPKLVLSVYWFLCIICVHQH